MATKKVTITARLCETKPPLRIKVYDEKCPGLYVSITPAGVATFAFRYWDRTLGKRAAVRIGDYDPIHLTIEDARSQAFDLKGRVGRGEDVAQTARKAKTQQAKLSGKTVGGIIDEYLEWGETPVVKPDGGLRPRLETWWSSKDYLDRYVRPTLGRRIASEVDNDDIAKLQDDILNGRLNAKFKPSLANAISVRKKMSAMFSWAAQAGRRYVKISPCHNLPPLDPPPQRERVLSAEEIRTLWWGLDRPDLPCSRIIALALKFELVTMLRSCEYLGGTLDELIGLGTPEANFQIPAPRVKKRRPIIQPLSGLAQEILTEVIKDQNQQFIFPGRYEGISTARHSLSKALRGDKRKNGDIMRAGICRFLGIKPFTPHDLRRTAASIAFWKGYREIDIGLCLDHQKSKSADAPARVTGIYVRDGVFPRSRKLDTKRKILDAVAEGIREIIGTNPATLKKAA